MLKFLVLFSGFSTGFTFGCPIGYTNDGIYCYKLYSTRLTRFQALRTCQKDGAILFPAANQSENDRLWNFSKQLGDSVWVGVTCVTSETSCINDEGTPNPYSNFLSPPNSAGGGACAILRPSNGNWFSMPCSASTALFVCKYTGNLNAQKCEPGSWLFNGHCYKLEQSQDAVLQEDFCANYGGHSSSIHSSGENNFVFDVAYNSLTDSAPFYRIGLLNTVNGNKWIDGSLYDYSNWGPIVSTQLCTNISLDGRVISRGSWIGSECGKTAPVVCKKEAIIPGPPATRVSTLCTPGAKMQPNGSFWSPNYPASYGSHNCSNVITWESSTRLFLHFPELYLGPGDVINLYSDPASSRPDYTLNYTTYPYINYQFTRGQLKIEFIGNNDRQLNYRWRGFMSTTEIEAKTSPRSIYYICGYNVALVDSGDSEITEFITGGYQNSYVAPCSLLLTARTPKNTVVVDFYDFYAGPEDVITFYDGLDRNSTVLKQVKGAQPGLSVESTGLLMFIDIPITTPSFRGIWGKLYTLQAVSCPSGYTADSSEDCYKLYSTPLNRFQALRTCQQFSGTLYPVANAFENTNLVNLANELQPSIWLGLTCISNQSSSCYTDEGRPNPYSNFYDGQANTRGACVRLNIGATTWTSSSCLDTAPFVCKYVRAFGNNDPSCSPGGWLFNGHCYSVHTDSFPRQAEQMCENAEGHVASVHSIGENNFIRDVVLNSLESQDDTFFRIGLFRSDLGNFSWADHSSYDFNNFGLLFNYSCTHVSLSDGSAVKLGQWISNKCEVTVPTVCKKGANVIGYTPLKQMDYCNKELSPGTTFWSPDYPGSYGTRGAMCSYSMRFDAEKNSAYLQFPELYLRKGDEIKIYDDISGSSVSLVDTVTFSSAPLNVYEIKSGQVNIKFNGATSKENQFRWRGIISFITPLPSIVTTCSDISTPGQFQSPNYSNGTGLASCKFLFTARSVQNTVVLNFFDFYIGPNDVVTFYDGNSPSNNQIISVSGPQTDFSVESTGQFLLMDSSGIAEGYRGFWGDFYSN